MEQLLCENKGFRYFKADTFESSMLTPIIKNLLHKAENEWDDYDEVYHCCHLIEAIRRYPGMKTDFHYIKKGGENIGIGLITHGLIHIPLFFPENFRFSDPRESVLVFNYFHISPEGRGTGGFWLKDIILPHYSGRGFTSLYVKSSHPRVFTLYGRLGENIGEYISRSDNGLQTRPGKIFRIPLTR